MRAVLWTENAIVRLASIEEFIGRDDRASAAAFVDGIVARADTLMDHPAKGRILPESPESGLRELLVGKYRLVYRIRSDAIEILTVFEGHRRLRAHELDRP